MDTKREISKCALKLFLRDGYENLSMRKIAACAGISATAIYRHYRDKKDMVQDLVRSGFSVFARYLYGSKSGNLDESAAPRERLLKAFQDYKNFALEQPEYYRLIFLEADVVDFRSLPDDEKGEGSRTLNFLVGLFADLLRHGGMDAHEAEGAARLPATALWAQAHGLAALFTQGRLTRREFEPMYDVAVERALQGWEHTA